jgi:hypothetical protein
MDMPSTSAMPSSSRTRPRKKGNAFISSLKALFKVCRNTNDVVRAQAQAKQSINRIERHLGIEETDWPAFPPSPPRDFPGEWEHYDVGDDDDDEDDECLLLLASICLFSFWCLMPKGEKRLYPSVFLESQ